MKIILVKTPYLSLFRTETENAYPLGLAYIASSLRAAQFEVLMLDPENQGLNMITLKEKLIQEKPDVVGISCTTMNFDTAKEIAKIGQEIGAKTIVGGSHATAAYEEIIKTGSEFDFVVFGEAEQTIVELCTALNTTKKYETVLGLAYKDNSSVHINETRPFLKNLDEFPSPQWDLLDLGLYTLPDFIYSGKKGMTLVSARGCPGHCIFCSVHLINGREFRYFSAKRLIEDIENLVNKHHIEFIAFRDDTFTVSKERVREICTLLLEKKIPLRWYCLARSNTVDLEILQLMKKAGCEMIHYGVEAGDQKILNLLKKGMTLEQLRQAFVWTHAAGIKTVGSFIFGNPTETQESMDKTLAFALELNPYLAHFFVMAPLPGTELWENYKHLYFEEGLENRQSSYGIYSMTETSNFHCGDLTYDNLKKQLVKAHRAFYCRPTYILNKIKEIRNYGDAKMLAHNSFALAKNMLHLS